MSRVDLKLRTPNALRDFGSARRSTSVLADVRYAFGLAEDMTGCMDPNEMDDVRRMLRAIRNDVLARLRRSTR